jgi:release factor glutamine methyltransferase
MTVSDLLKKSIKILSENKIRTAELDVRVLICHAIKKDKVFLLTHGEYNPTRAEQIKINKLVKLRSKNIPLAYLIREKEFFKNVFHVDERVLIPRPESEYMVEKALEYIKNSNNPNLSIIDIGTGSGCIILSLAKELEKNFSEYNLELFGSDISLRALAVANKNAKRLSVENHVKVCRSDLFNNKNLHRNFDLIIANLPYVPKNQASQKSLAEEGIKYEPQNAIFAGDNGAAVIKEFLNQAREHINQNGLILIELDPRNAKQILTFSTNKFPDAKIILSKDLAGRDRYLQIILK